MALGERSKRVGMAQPKKGAGLWRIAGDGEIPMVAVDDVVFEPVDAIVLDVEGYEPQALEGAHRVITTYRPLLWFEFLHHRPAIETFLADHGYSAPMRGLGGDWYSVHA